MNQQSVANLLEKHLRLSEQEKKLVKEEQFIRKMTEYVQSKTKAKIVSDILINIMKSILKRYRQMVQMDAKEIKTNKRLFYHLFKEKLKDNFKTFDSNLVKFKIRNKLRKTTGINY